MKCKKCGYELSSDSNFCEICGTKVADDNQTTVEDKPKVEEDNHQVVEDNHQVVEDNQNIIDVSDLGPDDLDDLMPKKSHTGLICFIILLLLVAIASFTYFNLSNNNEKKKEEKEDYQTIINEYGKAVETVASDYLLEHELINSFDEIKDSVKYDKHKVSCDNVIINIDGTVYLSECTIDGKKVDEVYGRKKNILTKDDACNIITDKDDNVLSFYVDSELISVYECDHDKCGLYAPANYNSCTDMITVIEDGSKKYLYSYMSAQNLLDPLDEIIAIKDGDKFLGFIVQDSKTEKYGYVDTRGTIKLEIEYDSLGLIYNGTLDTRSISGNKITASKDDKYGVINLNTGKEIIPFKYDNAYIGVKDYYVVKEDKKYYLIDSSSEKVLSKGYNMIFTFDDLLVVNDDNKLQFIDYKGDKVYEQEIDTYIDYKEVPVRGIFGYNVTKMDDDILIEVNKSKGSGYDTIEYIYHVKTKILEVK